MVNTIIDIYYANDVEPADAAALGVVGIIHKASEALDFRDPKYRDRRDAAQDLGLLWGAYHLSSGQDPAGQVGRFLDAIETVDDTTLLALDWETSAHHGTASKQQTHAFIEEFHAQTGRYPVVYGGHTVRDACENGRDEILAQCPLWYVRYRTTPLGLPTNTWPTYALWQYSNGRPEDDEITPPTYALGGADWNRFDGSVEQLRAVWPFISA
jgi:lysozyme